MLISIVVVFPKVEDGKAIKSLLVRHGFVVSAVCTSGDQAMNQIDNYDFGMVVCGYRFNDMFYYQLYENLPKSFEMLLVASGQKINEGVPEGILSVTMPIKTYDLINTVDMIMQGIARKRKKLRAKPTVRDESQKEIIAKAKQLLMERNNMSEEEAYRYIQKSSMDSGTNMIETAQMVLQVFC